MCGDKIRELRIAKGWSTKELANKLQYTPSGWRMIERNERDISTDTLKLLTIIFNVSADYILGIVDNTKEAEQ